MSTCTENDWPGQGYANRPIHEFVTPIANALASWIGVASDLQRAKEYLDAIPTAPEKFHEALFAAALIAYRRAFTTGRRLRLDKSDVSDLALNAAEVHKYLYDLASKLIAHPVNELEDTAIGIIVDDDKESVIGIGQIHLSMSMDAMENIPTLSAFIGEIISRKLEPRIDECQKACEAEARAMPFSELKRRPLWGAKFFAQTESASKLRPWPKS